MLITKRLNWVLLCITLSFAAISRADFDQGLVAYEKGDYKAAFAEFKPLAEQGDADAQYNLALMYRNGKGTAQDDKQAVYWYQKSAEQGNAQAQHNLGWMYRNGKGTAQDDVKAYMWLNIAAANGDKEANTGKDILTNKMSRAAIEKAQSMSSQCMASNYQNC